ncbi:MAG: 4'-phosphopantetheinyl transferase superfamily protein, partial [Armatimonadota bacterium]|nr:4'-phosphopantetheinyl transferase superfamily protein [Armatimonadota bacterium]
SQDPAHWLTASELAVFAAWRSEMRRREWLAGRLAAKRLIRDAFGLSPLAFAIGRDGDAPCVLGADTPQVCLSLSHSHGLGAATFSNPQTEGTAGIDAQWVRPVHPGLCRRVFTPEEQAQISGIFGREDDLKGMLLLWALKEAAIKARRTAWGHSLRSIEVRLLDDNRAVIQMPGESPLTAAYEWLDGWWLARAVREAAQLQEAETFITMG